MKGNVDDGLVELEKVQRSEFLLDGFLTKGSVLKTSYGGKEYEIEQYQGEHANEYCVYEVKNGVRDGTAELFNDGMITMRWTMKKGVRDGRFLIYDRGVVVREGRWCDIGRNEERVINNNKAELIMTIRVNGQIVYEGDYNESMERDCLGYEYENGVLKGFGEWRKDEFVELKQRFISKNEMIEYGGGSTRNLLSHKPIYVGGYIFDEASGRMKRNGAGRVLNEWSGVCEYESEWEKGEELSRKRVPLHDGWYHKSVPVEFTRRAVTGYEPFMLRTKGLLGMQGTGVKFEEPSQIEEFSMGRSYYGINITELKLNGLNRLKRFETEPSPFSKVEMVDIDGMNELESIHFSNQGRSDYTHSGPYSDESSMRIVNCCKLKSVIIDLHYCTGYRFFELRNLPSLESLKIGESCFCHVSSLSLTSILIRFV